MSGIDATATARHDAATGASNHADARRNLAAAGDWLIAMSCASSSDNIVSIATAVSGRSTWP